MVQEKVDAAVEGAFAAQAAWGAFLIKAAFGGVRTPNDVSMGLAGIAEAAAKPARRKVRANALPPRRDESLALTWISCTICTAISRPTAISRSS